MSECISLAFDIFGHDHPWPRIDYSLRGHTAGQAYPQLTQSRLNAELLVKYKDQFIERTVIHEVAHLVARSMFGAGIRPHGKEWKNVMRAFGVREPTTCHTYETTPARNAKTVKAVCGCKTHALGMVRARRLARGQTMYRCNLCKSPLKLA